MRWNDSGDNDEDYAAWCKGCEVDAISTKVIVN